MNNNYQSYGEGIHWCGGRRPNSLRPSRPAPGSALVHAVFTRYLLERLLWRTFMNNIIMYISHNDRYNNAMCLMVQDLDPEDCYLPNFLRSDLAEQSTKSPGFQPLVGD